MAAKKGNQNAIGNKGGTSYPAEIREMQIAVRRKVLQEIIDILESKPGNELNALKPELLLKLAPKAVPEELDLGSGSGVKVLVVNYGESHHAPA